MNRTYLRNFRQWRQRVQNSVLWLTPGLGIKRWLLALMAGVTLVGLGTALILLDFYRTAPEDSQWLPFLTTLSLSFLSRPLRVIIFGGLGLGLTIYATLGLNRALLKPFVRPGRRVYETVSTYRRRERGPRIVALGGGTGLSSLLRGLKEHTHNITAIVTVADDGGSSGELRRNMGILPPGDIRNCLAALSNDEALLAQIFQYRFGEGAGLNGHSLGNLFITALADLTGSFEEAVAESGRVLAVHGKVMPSTLHNVRLIADVQLDGANQGVQVKGESQITKAAGKVHRIWLEPDNPSAFPPAIQAILGADLIIVGPGSLYTSILPNILVPDLAQAIKSSRALKLFICNVATQEGETTGYSCGDHVRAIEKYLGGKLFEIVVVNECFDEELPPDIEWVRKDYDLDQEYSVYVADLVDREHPHRHDSTKLAQVVVDLYYEKTGPLSL